MEQVLIPTRLLLDRKISDSAKILYSILLSKVQENYTIKISQKDISEIMETSDRTVRNLVAELRDNGLMAIYNKGKKSINIYVLLPYGLYNSIVEVEDEADLNNLIYNIKEHTKDKVILLTDKKKKRSAKIKTPLEIIEEIDNKLATGEDLTNSDIGKYFFKKLYEKKGLLAEYKGVKQLSIIKRVMAGRSRDEVLNIIDTFIDVYDDMFNKPGFEIPKIEGLGTQWIFNKVATLSRNRVRREQATEDDLAYDDVF